jgi:hypothetical protein
MEVAKEAGILMVKPIAMWAAGYMAANLAEFEIFTELLGEEYSTAKNVIALIGLGFIMWRAYRVFIKTEREKDQAYEEKKIDIEDKAWELAHKQKKASEEGLVNIIKELDKDIKELKKTIKNIKK